MFEDLLIESAKHKAGFRKAITLPVSIVIHAIAIGAALGASVWFVEDVPEPPIPVTFYPPAPPSPPPPLAAAKTSARVPASPKPIRPTEMVAPTVIPEKIPQPAASSELEESIGTEGGVEGGVEGGIPGGAPGSNDVGTGSDVNEKTFPVGGDVKAPRLIFRLEPTYPDSMIKIRKEGVVILEAIITSQGNVEKLEVLKSVNPLLDAAAARAVEQWKYQPATLNGRAVRVYLTVTVTFHLH